MLQKVLSKLLTHAGFEGAKVGPLNVLTDVMAEYLTNIGKTLRCYWDDYGHKMDGDVRRTSLFFFLSVQRVSCVNRLFICRKCLLIPCMKMGF